MSRGIASGIVLTLVCSLLPDARADVRTEAFCAQENSAWDHATSIPSNRPWIGEFVESYDRVRQRIEALIDEAREQPDTDSARRIADLYDAAIETQRASVPIALLQTFAGVDEYRTHEELARLIARIGRQHRDLAEGSVYPVPAPFLITVWTDDSNTSRNIGQLTQSGLGLPGREYYLESTPALVSIRERYRNEMRAALVRQGHTQPTAADEVLRFETEIARLQWSSTQQQDRSARRQATLTELKTIAPAFDWTEYFDAAGLPRNAALSLRQPSYVAAVTSLFRTTSIQTVKNYFRWQLARHYAPYLPADSGASIVAFYQQEILGSKSVPTAREVAINLVESYLASDLEALYLHRYFSPQSRSLVARIGDDIRTAFVRRLGQSDLLSSGAKAEAIQKIQRLNIEIGYPASADRPGGAEIRKRDLIGTLMQLSAANYGEQIARLSRPADPKRWWISPLSVNASYSQSANTLIVPAGRLQPPLFDARATDAANFGGVGTLIGHEMGHAIDNQGRQYDRLGVIREWWTAADASAFEQRTQRLVSQYAGYESLGEHINGRATLSENIADLLGLSLAHDAMLARGQGALAEEQQRQFLRSWAQRWRAKYSPSLLLRVIKSDTHAPNNFRCSGPLENFGPFYDAMRVSRPDNLLVIW